MTAKEAIELAKVEPDVWVRDKEGDLWRGYDLLEDLYLFDKYEPYTVLDFVPRGKISKVAAEEIKEQLYDHQFTDLSGRVDVYNGPLDYILEIIDDMTEEEEE